MSLYPNTKFLDRDEYDLIVELARGKSTALEFGPGATTWALIDAGVSEIDTYEYVEKWRRHALTEFAGYCDNLGSDVRVGEFANVPDVITTPDAADHYDIAIVDSPKGDPSRVPLKGQEKLSRYNTLRYAVERSPLVLLHDAKRRGEMASIDRLSREFSIRIKIHPSRRGMAIIERVDG